jgi:hypothetical protein
MKHTRPTIDAREAWRGNIFECRKLYEQFRGVFNGSFRAISVHYGWKRAPMVRALRTGKESSECA